MLNPTSASVPVTPLHPYVLPYAAIDFDDANKVQQAVENTGCLVQYRQYGAVCVAVGNNPGLAGSSTLPAALPATIWWGVLSASVICAVPIVSA